MSHPVAPKEGHDAHHDHAPEKKADHAKEKVDATMKGAHDKVTAVVPHAKPDGGHDKHPDAPAGKDTNPNHPPAPGPHDVYTPPEWLKNKTSPLPSAGTVGKGLLTAAFIANPVATTAIAAPVGVGLWGWNKINKYPPFSWADRAGRATYNTVKGGVTAMATTAIAPFKWAGEKSLNILRTTVGRPLDRMRLTVVDWWHHTPGESKSVFEGVIDRLKKIGGTILDVPHALLEAAKDLPKQVLAHPWRTSTGLFVTADIIRSLLQSSYTSVTGQVVTAGLNVLQGIAKWFGAPIPPIPGA